MPIAVPGRTTSYKNIPDLPVPADLVILTCDHCGTEWFGPDDARRIDAALAAVYKLELLRRAREALPAAEDAPRLERQLGLSPGYLSRICRAVNDALRALIAPEPPP